MAIKGLTDQLPDLECCGYLRKGEPKNADGTVGKDLGEFFRFTSENPVLVAEFQATFGARPSLIPVYLPFRYASQNWEAWMEHWVAGGLRHRCDGETCVRWYDDRSHAYRNDPIPCPGGCTAVGRLRVIVRALNRFAYVTVLTSAKNDIVRLSKVLPALEAVNGSLQGIPFLLHRTQKAISTPSGRNGTRARRKKWLILLEPEPDWVEIQMRAAEMRATLQITAESQVPDEDEADDPDIPDGTGDLEGAIATDPDEDGRSPDELDDVVEGDGLIRAEREEVDNLGAEPDLDEVFGAPPQSRTTTVNNPMALRDLVNREIGGEGFFFPTVVEMLTMIGEPRWPDQRDTDGWNRVYNASLAYAAAHPARR